MRVRPQVAARRGVALVRAMKAGHLVLGELDLLATEVGEGEVGNLEIGRTRSRRGGGIGRSGHDDSPIGGDLTGACAPAAVGSRPGSPDDSPPSAELWWGPT